MARTTKTSKEIENFNKLKFQITKTKGESLKTLSPNNPNYEDLALHSVFINPFSFISLDDSLRNNKDFILRCVEQSAKNMSSSGDLNISEKFLECVSEEIKNDKEFIKKCVLILPQVIPFLDKLKDDREIMLLAIKQEYPTAMTYCSPRLALDKSFVLEAVALNATCLDKGDIRWKYDHDVIKTAITTNTMLGLSYADKSKWNNYSILLHVFKTDALAIQSFFGKEFINSEIVSQFINKVSKEDENTFIEALHEIDFCKDNLPHFQKIKYIPPTEHTIFTIDFILSNISKEKLEKIVFDNNYIKERSIVALKNKTILNVKAPNFSVKKSKRKVW